VTGIGFTNARLVLSAEVIDGTLLLDGEAIARVEAGGSQVPGLLDCEGDYLLPGLVELHTDNLERHVSPRPGVHWPIRAALLGHDAEVAAAGITTVLDALAVGYMEDEGVRSRHLAAMAEAIAATRLTGLTRAEHGLHLRCEIGCRDLMRLFDSVAAQAPVHLVSIMDHAPGQRQYADVSKFRLYYQGKYRFDDAAMDAFEAACLERSARWGAANRRAVVAWARREGVALASHDDATAEHIAEAVADGAVLAEFPTTVEAARNARAAGLKVLMGAPNLVRGGSHSGNVATGDLVQAGLLDLLSSDYVPASLLQGAFQAVAAGVPVPTAVGWVTREAADAVGLADRGRLAPGLRADLVRVRLDDGLPVVRGVWRAGRRVA